MARRAATRPRNGRLEEAMALLLENQAMFAGQMGHMQDRFARIEAELEAIKAILIRHEQMLEALPEAVRQKIGFRKS
jgi:hypothetical protein